MASQPISQAAELRDRELELGREPRFGTRLAALVDGRHAQMPFRGTSYATGGWRGDLSVGTELVTRTGSPILALQHTTGYDWHVRPRLSLFMGGRAVVAWDTLHPEASHAELGMPLGIGWRRVELQWIPALSLPLAHDRREVRGGEVRRGVAVNFMPLNVSLTVKLGRHPRQDRR